MHKITHKYCKYAGPRGQAGTWKKLTPRNNSNQGQLRGDIKLRNVSYAQLTRAATDAKFTGICIHEAFWDGMFKICTDRKGAFDLVIASITATIQSTSLDNYGTNSRTCR
jgi:hypothetical protein